MVSHGLPAMYLLLHSITGSFTRSLLVTNTSVKPPIPNWMKEEFPAASGTDVQYYRAEARFLRALSYWHAIDLFANVPFVTENDPVGAFFPPQIMRADLFDYVESELLSH